MIQVLNIKKNIYLYYAIKRSLCKAIRPLPAGAKPHLEKRRERRLVIKGKIGLTHSFLYTHNNDSDNGFLLRAANFLVFHGYETIIGYKNSSLNSSRVEAHLTQLVLLAGNENYVFHFPLVEQVMTDLKNRQGRRTKKNSI
jgi:hypothetical protein